MAITPASAGNGETASTTDFEQILSKPCGSLFIMPASGAIEVRVKNERSPDTHKDADSIILTFEGALDRFQFDGPIDNRIQEVWVKASGGAATVTWTTAIP
jgi:hypothetical protein